MRTLLSIFVILTSLTTVSRAGDPPRPIPPESLVGSAAFDWAKGHACKVVKDALVKKWAAGYVCMPPDEATGTSSGKPLRAVCKANKGKHEFLVFATIEDCKAEHDSQAANE